MPAKLKNAKSRAKRRGNNEGSIYQRKDGRWCGAVTVGYKTDGKPVRKTAYGSTRQEVAKKVALMTEDVFTNGYTTVSGNKAQNFEVLFREWFDLFVVPNLASVTEENRRCMMKNHIFKAFGALDVQNVDLVRLQRFFNEKVKAGLSPDTVSKLKNLLSNFFSYAVKQHYTRANPMQDVVISKCNSSSDESNAKALRPEIRQDVFALIAASPVLKPIILTFSFTGLRPQELIALKWENVNLANKSISVKEALNRVVEFDEDGNVVSRGAAIGRTKTPKSVRGFTLPDVVASALQEWRSHCDAHNIISEFVFPNAETGEMRTYWGLRSLLTRFIKTHRLEGEKITLYTFRHTFATILLEQRESPKIVAELMGHKKVSTTLDLYSHVVSSSVYEQTARTLDGVYASIVQTQSPTSSLQPAGLNPSKFDSNFDSNADNLRQL